MRELSSVSDVEMLAFLGLNLTAYPCWQLASANTRVAGPPASCPKGPATTSSMRRLPTPPRSLWDLRHLSPVAPSHLPLGARGHLVVTHRDCTHERFPGFRFTDHVLRAKRTLFERADRITRISESSLQDLFAYYNIDSARTRAIHHGFTRLERSPAAAAELEPHVRRELLLYVGSRVHYKNFDGFLRAFAASRPRDSFDALAGR